MVALSLAFPAPALAGFNPLPNLGIVQQLPEWYYGVRNGPLETPQIEVLNALGQRYTRRPRLRA